MCHFWKQLSLASSCLTFIKCHHLGTGPCSHLVKRKTEPYAASHLGSHRWWSLICTSLRCLHPKFGFPLRGSFPEGVCLPKPQGCADDPQGFLYGRKKPGMILFLLLRNSMQCKLSELLFLHLQTGSGNTCPAWLLCGVLRVSEEMKSEKAFQKRDSAQECCY